MRKKPCLTSSDVHKMAAACRAEAEKNKWNVTIAIVDDAGVLLYLDRMDGASATTAEVATAESEDVGRSPDGRRNSGRTAIKDRPAFMNFPGVLQIQGGLPIMYRGRMRRRDRRLRRAVARGRADRQGRHRRADREKFSASAFGSSSLWGPIACCCWPGVSWSGAA